MATLLLRRASLEACAESSWVLVVPPPLGPMQRWGGWLAGLSVPS